MLVYYIFIQSCHFVYDVCYPIWCMYVVFCVLYGGLPLLVKVMNLSTLNLKNGVQMKGCALWDYLKKQWGKCSHFRHIQSIMRSCGNFELAWLNFPTMWKMANIVPVPKSNNHASPTNCRPFSLLPALSKLVEHHIHFLLTERLSSNDPHIKKQKEIL